MKIRTTCVIKVIKEIDVIEQCYDEAFADVKGDLENTKLEIESCLKKEGFSCVVIGGNVTGHSM